MSMNTALSGSGRVDDIQSHPQGEFRGQTNLVKITEDVRKYAARHGLTSEKRSNVAYKKNHASLSNKAPTYMQKRSSEGIERRGTTRDGRAGPRGREGREEFESMQEKRKEFVESGAEVYAKT